MKKSIALLITSLVLLSACGQKGPLYMPEDTTQTEEKNKDETDS